MIGLRCINSRLFFTGGLSLPDRKETSLEDLEGYKYSVRPAYKVDFLVRAMLAQGVAPELVLADTALKVELLQQAETRVSMVDLIRVYANVQKYSNDPAIALKVGKQINASCYGIYGHALLSYRTIREALMFSINFHGMVTRTVRMELVESTNSELAYLRFNDLLKVPSLFHFNIEFQLGIVLALFRDMLGKQNITFKEARVTYDAPAHASIYTELLGCPVIFSQPENEYVIEKSWLDYPLPRSNPFGLEILLKACEQELNELCKGDGLLITVRKIIFENLDGDLSAELVASRLNITSRTLRRRLAERGISFREVVADLRAELAQKYLAKTALTIDAIAARIGYSDTTNFRHAFKRSVGATPGDYRKKFSENTKIFD